MPEGVAKRIPLTHRVGQPVLVTCAGSGARFPDSWTGRIVSRPAVPSRTELVEEKGRRNASVKINLMRASFVSACRTQASGEFGQQRYRVQSAPIVDQRDSRSDLARVSGEARRGGFLERRYRASRLVD